MTQTKMLLAALCMLSPALLRSQSAGGVDPADLRKPLQDSWPTYSGDYTGKRYSVLDQINQSTVTHLTLAWMAHVTPGSAQGARGFGRAPVIVGGEGPGDINVGGGTIKASALEVDGILYFTMPDNAWAVDARDGSELWHYFWKTKGGTHIGNRGLGMWHKTSSWKRRTIIWSPSMRARAKSSGTRKSQTWRRAISPRPRRWSSGTMCW